MSRTVSYDSPSFGWRGERVRLVPLDKDRHLENCIRWLNDPAVIGGLGTSPKPLTRLREEEFFESAAKATNAVHFAIETLDGEHIGQCGLHGIKWRIGEAVTGTFIGRTDLWGKGYASDAVAVRTRYAFHDLGLRMLISEVFGDNAGSLRALERAGYEHVGCIPERTWNAGRWHDVVWLMINRRMWEERERQRGVQALDDAR